MPLKDFDLPPDMCDECPHRDAFLHGGDPVVFPDFPTRPHPCHLRHPRACAGHARQLELGTAPSPEDAKCTGRAALNVEYADGTTRKVILTEDMMGFLHET